MYFLSWRLEWGTFKILSSLNVSLGGLEQFGDPAKPLSEGLVWWQQWQQFNVLIIISSFINTSISSPSMKRTTHPYKKGPGLKKPILFSLIAQFSGWSKERMSPMSKLIIPPDAKRKVFFKALLFCNPSKNSIRIINHLPPIQYRNCCWCYTNFRSGWFAKHKHF